MRYSSKFLKKDHIELAGVDQPHISDWLIQEVRTEIKAKLKKTSVTSEDKFQEIVTATVAEIMPLWVYND
ncbi:hypothetical protein cce_4870 [Crocosphaera subtropica ATCC 51142]|uniref:Uncharacterized protein n=1 Tax=Crocosphaera subtropica (strain ATCC 51142 / BH68) TaxID=43989 RepID=B1X256_CROS5|nr:hypothetical protein [Crocosphaera subtropica]ACB54217.1 hypothetical protein cce_4870 [Crocosphaera subtropica ATCC 51142]